MSNILYPDCSPDGYIKMWVDVAASTATPTAVSGSSGIAVSDNFNRANNAIGANWGAVSGVGDYKVASSRAIPSAVVESMMVWAADDFSETPNQFAEINVSPDGWGFGTLDGGRGPLVRGATASETCYCVGYKDSWDGLEGQESITLYKVVSGIFSQLGSVYSTGSSEFTGYVILIEITGSNIVVKNAVAHGGPYTTRITATDSSISSGSPGMLSLQDCADKDMDDFYAGSTCS